MRFICNQEIKAAIITGSGAKALLPEPISASSLRLMEKAAKRLPKRAGKCFDKIENSPKPIIAAVNGFALEAAVNWQWPAIPFGK